jgi:hypothetical protein
MVMMVFHEPSSPRIEDVNTLWSGFFSSVTSLNLEGVCGLGTGPSVSHVRIFTLETIWPRIAEFFKMKYASPQRFPLAQFMSDKEPLWKTLVKKYDLLDYSFQEAAAWPFGEAIFNLEYEERQWTRLSPAL